MNFTLLIPDDLALRLGTGDELARRALEAFGVEEFRAGRITQFELRQLLGFATRAALDDFLLERCIYTDYSIDDLEQDRLDLDRLGF